MESRKAVIYDACFSHAGGNCRSGSSAACTVDLWFQGHLSGNWKVTIAYTQTHMINIAMDILPSLKINGQCISPLSTTRSSQLFVTKNGVPSFWGLPCLHSHLGVDIKINIAKQKNSHNWNRIEIVIPYYFRNTNLGCGLIIFHHVPSFSLLFHGYPGI